MEGRGRSFCDAIDDGLGDSGLFIKLDGFINPSNPELNILKGRRLVAGFRAGAGPFPSVASLPVVDARFNKFDMGFTQLVTELPE
jgi:hypothetical protein